MSGASTAGVHGPSWGFPLSEAVALLDNADLLNAVLLPSSDGLVWHEPSQAVSSINNTFAGARLDSRLLQAGELFVALPGEHVHGRRFAPAWLQQGGWVLTDTASGDEPLSKAEATDSGGVLLSHNPEAALALLATTWRQGLQVRVVGVTGTNGKTTTKDFLAAALSGAGLTHATAGNFNNHLGLPLTLLGLRPEHRFAVIEMGASAVGEIDHLAALACPDVGVITNASPAHLAEFGSLAGIITGKGELLDHLGPAGSAILNSESPGWPQWQARAQCRVVSCGQKTGDHQWAAAHDAGGAILVLDQETWPVPLPGRHNAANMAMAILAGRELGATDQEMRQGLDAFRGSPHRGVRLEIGGRIVLDDSYNANPGSMIAAAQALLDLSGTPDGGRTFAALGHMAEMGADAVDIHRETGRELGATGLDILVAVGTQAQALSEGFDAVGGGGHYCASQEEAARWLASRSRPGDRILIKGSRSAAMENVLPLLAKACRENDANDQNQS